MNSGDLVDLNNRAREAADALQAKASEILELAQELERLTKDTPAWCTGMRARVEVRTVLEQTEEIRRVLQEPGEAASRTKERVLERTRRY